MKLAFASSLQILRKKQNLSQRELAQKAGVTQATLSRLENGLETPRWFTLQQLAQALGIESSTFLSETVRPAFSLNRHQIEEVAKAVLSGERRNVTQLNSLADQIARLMIQKLKAYGCPGYKRVQHFRWRAPYRRIRLRAFLPDELLKVILIRADRLLPRYIKKEENEDQ